MVVVWLVVPLGRFLRYLVSAPELARTRTRAMVVTAAVVAPLIAALVLPEAPDRWRIEGTVEPADVAYIHAGADGFITAVLPDNSAVADPGNGKGPTVLIEAVNHELAQDANDLDIAREIMACRRRIAQLESATDRHNLALVQILDAGLESLDTQQRLVRQQLGQLCVRSPLAGRWICPEADSLPGSYAKKGQRVGMVATCDRLIVVADCPEHLAGMLLAEASETAEIRVEGRPDAVIRCHWEIRPAGGRGEDSPPVRASSIAPGSLPGRAERFELAATCLPGRLPVQLLPGQTVTVRFDLPPRPLIRQWWRSVRQLIQRRFGL